MKKTITLFSFFLIFLLITINFSINDVNAISYYNHIQNPSFIVNENFIEDGGFESGEYESGLEYGNWTGDALIRTDEPNSGIYHIMLVPPDNNTLYYNFTSNYYALGSEIEEFWCYWWVTSGTKYLRVAVIYEDETSDGHDFYGDTMTEYEKLDILAGDFINPAKKIKQLSFSAEVGTNIRLDDFVYLVDTGEGQDSITMDTEPWKLGGTYPSYFGYINTVQGRLDNTSCQLSGVSIDYKLLQNIAYLDSDYIHFVDLYIKSADVADNDGITCSIVYSDRSTSQKTKYVTGDGSDWEYLNFGGSWINSDKYIIQIRFSLAHSKGMDCIIDDVGLWASVEYGWLRFSFNLSPNPITKGTFDFEAYQNTIYTFCGYVYNVSDGEMNENGTYSFTDSFGYKSGNLVNGQFNVTLDKRESANDIMLESIGVTIVIPESGEVLGFTITGYWYKTEVEEEEEEGVEDFFGTTEGQNWMLLFIMLFVPTMVLVGGLKDYVPPHISFICGFSLMVGVTRTTMPSIMPLWLLFVCVIVIGLLLFATIKRWM